VITSLPVRFTPHCTRSGSADLDKAGKLRQNACYVGTIMGMAGGMHAAGFSAKLVG
jgi:hypothetical protein